MKAQYLEIAKIVTTHGIRGDMKAELYADSPDVIKNIKTLYLGNDGSNPLAVSNMRMLGRMLLLHADGIDTPEEAVKYRMKTLYASRDDIPRAKGDHFIADLIGLPVIDADSGERYGKLTDVIENPANAIYEVTCKSGKVLLPCVKEFVIRIDEDEGIFVRPIPGMFVPSSFSGDGEASES